MIHVNDPQADQKIRAALQQAENRGELGQLAARIGIAGGVNELRKILHSAGPLHIMDRGMIGLHLD